MADPVKPAQGIFLRLPFLPFTLALAQPARLGDESVTAS